MINRILWPLLLVLLVSPTTALKAQNKFTDLGSQVTATSIQGSVFADDSTGRKYVFTVVRGRPARLLGFDVRSCHRVVDLELNNSDGSWDLEVSSDGSLYIAGANGHLFLHRPGSRTVSDLGVVLPNEKVVWDLTAGVDGEIFGGTYPGCKVFRYHPASGFEDVGRGALVENENYVRSIAYHSKSGKIYAGIGSHAHLIELEPKTGEKKEMLDKKFQDQQYIYSLGLVEGLIGGDKLFAWLTSNGKRQTLIYNLNKGGKEHLFRSIDVRSVIKAPKGDHVFYTAGAKLYAANFEGQQPNEKSVPGFQGTALASTWTKEGYLLTLTSEGYLFKYDPEKGTNSSQRLSIPEQPIDIQTIGVGPDGKVWLGGYLAGGHAVYDPLTNKTTQYKGLHQTEGMSSQKGVIYFGIYPKAGLYAFDTGRPWNLKVNNPKHIATIKGQDRPFAVLSADSLGIMFFGTVPDYGKLGGTLVEYSPKTEEIKVFEGVVKNQSIVSLIYRNGLVIGGTSISGGLGIQPLEKEAKIFGWDPVKRKKLFEITPVPGAMAITGLIIGPGGNIWGVADENLIVFDPVKRKVVYQKQLYSKKPRGTHSWRNAFLELHPSGQIYGTVNNELFKIDPSSLIYTKISDDASLLDMDKQGTFYFRRGANLWSYDPD